VSDGRTRELERAVEQAPDDATGRHGLTLARLRARRGVVAFWHGDQRPHPAAAKVAFAFEVREKEDDRPACTQEVLGWAAAVTSPEDLLDLAAARSGCRVYDLGTGRAIGLFGEGEAVGKLGATRAQAATTDAFGRPRVTHVARGDGAPALHGAGGFREEWGAPGRGLQLLPAPYAGQIASRQVAQPCIYDTDVVDPGQVPPAALYFFTNTNQFSSSTASRKQYGHDTNIYGSYGGMPQAHLFVLRGVTLLVGLLPQARAAFVRGLAPEGGASIDGLRFAESAAREYVGRGFLTIRLAASDLATVPASLAIPREAGVDLRPGQDDGSCEARLTGLSIPAVLPLVAVVVLQPLESFRVELTLPGMPAPSGFYVRCVLHGDLYRGIAG
jgi:hypothetical protein